MFQRHDVGRIPVRTSSLPDLGASQLEDVDTYLDALQHLDAPITATVIDNDIRKLKWPGFDGILIKVIVNTDDLFMPHMLSMYNGLLESGVFPSVWSEGIIIPLFKAMSKYYVINVYWYT
jgi:hypothetical protein